MTTYTMIEKQNLNSEREGVSFEAKSLRGAKIAASKQQCFFGTVLELLNCSGETVAVKDKSGKWIEQSFFNC
jgi:hypothetical protein